MGNTSGKEGKANEPPPRGVGHGARQSEGERPTVFEAFWTHLSFFGFRGSGRG